MSKQQFYEDLNNKGIPCEDKALDFIKKLIDEKAYRVKGYDNEKDIVAPTAKLMFEVKNCADAKYTVPIEHYVEGKKTGILTTKSDYWIVYCREKYFVFPTMMIKGLIIKKEMKTYKIQEREVKLKLLKISDLEIWSDYVWS